MFFSNRVCQRGPVTLTAVLAVFFSAATLAAKETCPSVRATTNPGEERILAALDEAAPPMEFLETPLRDVLQYIKDAARIEIVIDTNALKAVGYSGETPVTVDLKGISLRSALGLLLAKIDLDYLIRDQVLLVTTADEARRRPEVRLYDVSALLDEDESADRIARLLQRTFSNPPHPPVDPATSSGRRMGIGGRRPSMGRGEVLGFGEEEGGFDPGAFRRAIQRKEAGFGLRGGVIGGEEGMAPPPRSDHQPPSHRQFYAYDQVIVAHDTERGHRQVAQFLNALGQALGKLETPHTHDVQQSHAPNKTAPDNKSSQPSSDAAPKKPQPAAKANPFGETPSKAEPAGENPFAAPIKTKRQEASRVPFE